MARLMAMRRSQKKMLRSWLLKVSMRSSAVRKVSLRTSSWGEPQAREGAGGWPGGRACLQTTEECTCGLSITLSNSGHDVSLVLDGGQIAGLFARQGCLLSSSQRGRGVNLTQWAHRRGHVFDPGISCRHEQPDHHHRPRCD